MKKILSILMLLAMLVCLGSASAFADEAEEADFLTVISGEGGTTYINLFEEILQEKYDDLWLKYCGDNAEQVAMLKEYISGNLYGLTLISLTIIHQKDIPILFKLTAGITTGLQLLE